MPNADDILYCISYDLGIGAGFYVDATQEPYSKHYKMYTYITEGTFNWLLALHSFHTEYELKKSSHHILYMHL